MIYKGKCNDDSKYITQPKLVFVEHPQVQRSPLASKNGALSRSYLNA